MEDLKGRSVKIKKPNVKLDKQCNVFFLLFIDGKMEANLRKRRLIVFVAIRTWMRVGAVGRNSKGTGGNWNVGPLLPSLFLEYEATLRMCKSLVIKIKMRKTVYNLHEYLTENIAYNLTFTSRPSDWHRLFNSASFLLH